MEYLYESIYICLYVIYVMSLGNQLDGANSSVLHTRFKLCKKLISRKNPMGTYVFRVNEGRCIGVGLLYTLILLKSRGVRLAKMTSVRFSVRFSKKLRFSVRFRFY